MVVRVWRPRAPLRTRLESILPWARSSPAPLCLAAYSGARTFAGTMLSFRLLPVFLPVRRAEDASGH